MRFPAAVGLAIIVGCGSTPAPKPADPTAQPLDIPPMAPETTPKQQPTPTPAPIATAPTTRDEFDDARDPLSKRPQRDRALVVTELQGLQRLLDVTPATAPDRPTLLLRTAQTTRELARQQEGLDASHSRTNAIQLLLLLEQSTPNYNLIDDVYYLLGLTSEQNGDGMNARKIYYELILKRPNSKWVPYAYFGFGEMFRSEAAQDSSKYELARQAYNEVLKYSQSDIQPFAKRRIDALPAR